MKGFTLAAVKRLELSSVTYAKGDRVVVNYGTTRLPEYYLGTIKAIRLGIATILFDDESIDKFKIPLRPTKTGIVGKGIDRKRKTAIPAEQLDKWLLDTISRVPRKTPAKKPAVPEVKPAVPVPVQPSTIKAPLTISPPDPVVPKKPVELSMDYDHTIYVQDSKNVVWKITKVHIKHLNKDTHMVYKQTENDKDFHSIGISVPTLTEAVSKLKQVLKSKQAQIVGHKVVRG